jgi:hypothetical protein
MMKLIGNLELRDLGQPDSLLAYHHLHDSQEKGAQAPQAQPHR